jgi:hypothetical protein
MDATRRLQEALALPVDVSDTTILGTALAEVAAEEILRNAHFGRAVRERYDELVALQKRPRSQASRQTKELPPLVAIRQDLGYRKIDPFAPPDLQFLMQVYGGHQLDRALQEYTLDLLKRTADIIQARHPKTKPTSRTCKDALIAYIVEHTMGMD